MSYTTEQFYTEEYRGEAIPGELVDTFLRRASRAIDRAVMYRIIDIDYWPFFARRQIQLAVCSEADNIFHRDTDEGVMDVIGVGSYSVGDVSVSMKQSDDKASDSLTGHYGLSEETIGFLMPTGLLDRRV